MQLIKQPTNRRPIYELVVDIEDIVASSSNLHDVSTQVANALQPYLGDPNLLRPDQCQTDPIEYHANVVYVDSCERLSHWRGCPVKRRRSTITSPGAWSVFIRELSWKRATASSIATRGWRCCLRGAAATRLAQWPRSLPRAICTRYKTMAWGSQSASMCMGQTTSG
jgi:hypothetical protein